MTTPLYIAVDLGAGSGRIFLVGFDQDEFFLNEVHRFRYPPYYDGQYLRWNFSLIFDEVKAVYVRPQTRQQSLGDQSIVLVLIAGPLITALLEQTANSWPTLCATAMPEPVRR
jgi:sugar (pentulose or hexulose) kinase